MYTVSNFLQKNPIQLAGVVVAWLNVAVIAGWLTVSAATVGGLNIALVGTLGLFVVETTVNKAKLDELDGTKPKQ